MRITQEPGRWGLTLALAVTASAAVVGGLAVGASGASPLKTASHGGSSNGLGQLSGLLPRTKLTEQSAINVNLSKQSVRLPLYRGRAHGRTVWYTLLDASDSGIADDLGVNYVPKLNNMAINCAACVQTVHLEPTTPQDNRFGTATVDFAGTPDFSPTRIATPGPEGFPLAKFQPGAVAGRGYSPFIRIAGSPVVYNAPIVAVGSGRFDVTHHTNTADRVLGIHLAGKASRGLALSGRYEDNWVDMLFVKGFDASQPIVYLSTDAGQPLTAVLERATYVPALNRAPYAGGDDFLGSTRESPTLRPSNRRRPEIACLSGSPRQAWTTRSPPGCPGQPRTPAMTARFRSRFGEARSCCKGSPSNPRARWSLRRPPRCPR